MPDARTIEDRSNLIARTLLLTILMMVVALGLVFYLQPLAILRLPLAYLTPIPLIYAIVLAVALYRLGEGPVPALPFGLGLLVLVGGPAFDMLVTVLQTPDLALEANPFVKTLLGAGQTVGFVLVLGFVMQLLLLALSLILWVAFLSHREVLIASAWQANPRTYFQFLKAALGGGHLSWRRWYFPVKMADLPKAYHLLWYTAWLMIGEGLIRWYLGLERLGLDASYRNAVSVGLMLLAMAGYLVWLWMRYSAGPPDTDGG